MFLFSLSGMFNIIVSQSSNLAQMFLLSKKFEIQYIGLIIGGLGGGGIIITKLLSKKILSLSIQQTLIFIILLTLCSFFLLINNVVFVFIIGILLLEVVKYLIEVYIVDAINRSYQGEMIASLNSVLSLIKRFSVMIFAPFIGVMIEKNGFHIALTYLAYFYLFISVVVIIFIFLYHNESK